MKKKYPNQIGFRKIRQCYFFSQQSKKSYCNGVLLDFLMQVWRKRTIIKTGKLFDLGIYTLLTSFLFLQAGVLAQGVSINSTGATPDASAILDVSSTTKGLLVPRMALAITTSALPVTAPATSLLVYNTATVNDVTPGYYYWNGTAWIRMLEGGTNDFWKTTGNAGTTVGTNFIGTTDAQDFAIYTNNTEKIRVAQNGNVGIGTATPNAKLEINGQVKITGGAPGNAKILTSDATGLATWNTLSVSDADSVIGNEYNTGASLTGTILNITDGGGTQIVDLATLNNEVTGTYTAIVSMFPAGSAPINASGATLTFSATGQYVKQGSLVYISITNLPSNINCNACTFYSISLPFTAITSSNFSMGHARGMIWRYNMSTGSTFLVEPRIGPGDYNNIIMSASLTNTHYSGYIGLRDDLGGTQGTFISSISGTYMTMP